MADAHSAVAQIPLLVSPYLRLPRAPTLPYTYRPPPSTLPPSSTEVQSSLPEGSERSERPRYVVSQSGRAAHPSELIDSYEKLSAHLKEEQQAADEALQKWLDDIAAREQAENRRKAPGWLDSQQRMLEPERKGSRVKTEEQTSAENPIHELGMAEPGQAGKPLDGGDELDRAFGVMKMS